MNTDKELEKIVKDVVIYLIKRRGRVVKKAQERIMTEWFSGFWLTDDAFLLEQCAYCAEKLANYAVEEYPNGTIKVGNLRLDKTFHDDRKQFYYNFGIEFGGC